MKRYIMVKSKSTKLRLIKTILWITIGFSSLALLYHFRWLVAYLIDNSNHYFTSEQSPFLDKLIQISTNIIFIYVSYLLIRLYKKYEKIGFFDKTSLDVFNGVIYSCICLAIIGATKIVSNSFYELNFSEWQSTKSSLNIIFRVFSKLLIFESPQTMYLLIAIILWAVKQFVVKALSIKEENESFI